ncbi:MAG: type IV pilus assembly protein PilM [Magnetococcales bacterium]|nr:type IV pilus assembly protein PilM [Magnetococcales bacterium]
MFSLGSASRSSVGLDIGSAAIKVVELKAVGKKWRLLRCGSALLPPEAVADGVVKERETVAQAVAGLLKSLRISNRVVAAAVSGSAVITKKIQLPIMTELDLEDQISLEAEEYIPFDIEDVTLDFQILTPTKGKAVAKLKGKPAPKDLNAPEETMEVLLAACRKDLLNNRLETLKAAGLTVSVLDMDLYCAANAYETFLQPPLTGETVAVINAGASLLNIVILRNGAPDFTRDHPFGGHRMLEEAQRRFRLAPGAAQRALLGEGLLPVPKETLHQEVIQPFLEQLVHQLGQTIDFYHQNHTEQTVQTICLAGGCALIPGIADFLSQQTGIPVETAQPAQSGKLSVPAEYVSQLDARYLVALGLALRGAPA